MPQKTKESGLLFGSVLLTFVSAFWLWQRMEGNAIFPPYPIIIILFLAGVWGVFSNTWNLLLNHRARPVIAVALSITVPVGAFGLFAGLQMRTNDTVAVEAARDVQREMEEEKRILALPPNPEIDPVDAALEEALEDVQEVPPPED